MLRPPDPRIRAHILNFGGEGTGKSTGWLNIARWSADTGSDAQFYVLDTDDSAETMMIMGDYPEANIHVWPGREWDDFAKFNDAVMPLVRARHDWVVVDFAGTAWEAVQDWYLEHIFGQDMGEYFMSVRQSAGQEMDGWRDWGTINKVYRDWANPLVYGNGAHLYMTAQATKLGDRDDRKVKALYAEIGQKPVGQKALGYQAHSVLYSNAVRPGEIFLTTLKELEGVKRLEAKKITDFTLDYLIGAQKWQM